ncbi:MAG: nucleoside-diphosphate kinase [Chitinispirillaceae bacterium]|nr:nucleoside-diphosphate kinase [Chitinispirillaceae bacterium]
MSNIEKTLAIIKPDAVAGGFAGKIISTIEEHGVRIAAMKMVQLSTDDARRFYAVHVGKSFYEGLIDFMAGGPCIVLVLEGENVLERWRTLMGPTDPQNAPAESIRHRFGTDVRHNATHGSDSSEAALLEIAFFFSGLELPLPSIHPKESSH